MKGVDTVLCRTTCLWMAYEVVHVSFSHFLWSALTGRNLTNQFKSNKIYLFLIKLVFQSKYRTIFYKNK